jgi:L-fuconolactonase
MKNAIFGPRMTRRSFIVAGAYASLAHAVPGSAENIECIDTHTHFYDPSRPGGIAWPPKDAKELYRTVLPAEYRKLAAPLGIAGTVVVEASPAVADNEWLLDLAAKEPFIYGVMGHLKPGRAGFAADFARCAAQLKFRGARVGGWDTKLEGPDTAFGRDLRAFMERGLAIDVLAKALPDLRIVINHCAGAKFTAQPPDGAWSDGVRRCAANANVFMKVSALAEQTGKKGENVPADIAFYEPTLKVLWDAFGEDRLLFGSNWPVSAVAAPLSAVHRLATEFARSKGPAAMTKIMRTNAIKAYQLPMAAPSPAK